MNAQTLRGTWTALITPFQPDESIDWQAFDGLINRQVAAGVTGILISGTTGESPTLTEAECEELIKRAKALAAGRCLIMAGTGTNSTKKTIEKTKHATAAGADAILLVNPYYNKPTQRGLYLHFQAAAQATNLPVVLYNIKGRTGVNLETPTLMDLARDVKNIIGVKEASGDLQQIKAVGQQKPANFIVLSGDDGLTFPAMRDCGAEGVISVASNIVPKETVSMVNTALAGDMASAEKLDAQLQPFFKAIFVETNPIPVKYAAFKLGWCQNAYRLPMCEISAQGAKVVDEVLKSMGLI